MIDFKRGFVLVTSYDLGSSANDDSRTKKTTDTLSAFFINRTFGSYTVTPVIDEKVCFMQTQKNTVLLSDSVRQKQSD